MANKTFDDFYATFARCAAEIRYLDDSLVPLLENAISDELTCQVIGLTKLFDFYDLVDFYRESCSDTFWEMLAAWLPGPMGRMTL